MLEISCAGLSLGILVQFTIEMCPTAETWKKTYQNPLLQGFKV